MNIVIIIILYMQATVWSDLVSQRSIRVETNFEEILEEYLSTKLPVVGGI